MLNCASQAPVLKHFNAWLHLWSTKIIIIVCSLVVCQCACIVDTWHYLLFWSSPVSCDRFKVNSVCRLFVLDQYFSSFWECYFSLSLLFHLLYTSEVFSDKETERRVLGTPFICAVLEEWNCSWQLSRYTFPSNIAVLLKIVTKLQHFLGRKMFFAFL